MRQKHVLMSETVIVGVTARAGFLALILTLLRPCSEHSSVVPLGVVSWGAWQTLLKTNSRLSHPSRKANKHSNTFSFWTRISLSDPLKDQREH